VERWIGSNRHFNACKARKVYTFSKDLLIHVAVTWLVVAFYSFTWTPRTLRQRVSRRLLRHHYRTPAMAAGLATDLWSLQDILRYPIHRRQTDPTNRKGRRWKKKHRKA
jgi:hypothetical protein